MPSVPFNDLQYPYVTFRTLPYPSMTFSTLLQPSVPFRTLQQYCTIQNMGDDGQLLLCRSKRERFLQFSWRHRPDSLLTPEQEAQIQKDFKRYSKKYQEEDELIHTQVSLFPAAAHSTESLVYPVSVGCLGDSGGSFVRCGGGSRL